MFARLPLMSHSASSIALTTLLLIGPLRQYVRMLELCHRSSMRSGSFPISQGFRCFSKAAITAYVWK